MTTPGTSAVGGAAGISGVNIGKTKSLAANDVLTWDGSNWVNAVASGGITSVATDDTLTGDGSVGAPLRVVSPFTGVSVFSSTMSGNGTSDSPLEVVYSLPAGTVNAPYGSSITYNTAGLIKSVVDNPSTNYVWLFQGTATAPNSTTPTTISNMVLTGGAPTNNPSSAFDLATCRFTAPSTGMYMFTVSGNFPTFTPSALGCGWLGLTNAFGALTTYQFFDTKTAQTGSGTVVSCTGMMYLTTNDTARIYVAQNTGSSQTFSNMNVIIFGLGKV